MRRVSVARMLYGSGSNRRLQLADAEGPVADTGGPPAVTEHPLTEKGGPLVVTGGHLCDTTGPLTEMGCQLAVTPEVLSPTQDALGCLEGFCLE